MTDGGRAQRTQFLRQLIEGTRIPPGEEFPCPYLPDRIARNTSIVTPPLLPGVYHSLMDLNFRRSGFFFYRPRCEHCDECRELRLLTSEFAPTRSQRRCAERNRDLRVEVGAIRASAEEYQLYRRYLESRHDGTMDGSYEEYERFIATTIVETIQARFMLGEKLVAVGLADFEPEALSAVYCFFDPDEKSRGLGTYNILWLIDECRRRNVPYLYLGYTIGGCAKMSYKSAFRPHEILLPDGGWERVG